MKPRCVHPVTPMLRSVRRAAAQRSWLIRTRSPVGSNPRLAATGSAPAVSKPMVYAAALIATAMIITMSKAITIAYQCRAERAAVAITTTEANGVRG